MPDTTSAEYVLHIEPAEPDDEGREDGQRWRAKLTPMHGDPFPLYGYGEFAVEAAVEVIAAYLSDPGEEA